MSLRKQRARNVTTDYVCNRGRRRKKYNKNKIVIVTTAIQKFFNDNDNKHESDFWTFVIKSRVHSGCVLLLRNF